MKTVAFASLVVGALIISAPLACAEDDKFSLIDAGALGGKFSGMVAFTTEYFSRGISNTKPGVPAIQGNLEFDHDSGIYVGLWGSNVKFAPPNQEASIELDWSAGYKGNITDAASYDLGATYFDYPQASRSDGLDFNYAEFYAKGAYDFGVAAPYVKLNYSPDYQFNSGSEWYIDTGVAVPIGRYLTANLHLGREMIDDNARFGLRDYWDYSAGLGTNMASLDVRVDYVASDLQKGGSGLGSCGTSACDRVVLTVSKSF